MTITTPVLAGGGMRPIEINIPWAVNYHTADIGAGGLSAELKAAPTRANSATYLTHVTMGIVDSAAQGYLINNKISLVDGAGAVVLGPIQMQAQGNGLFQKDFDPPLKITDGKALDVSVTRAAGSYNTAALIYVEGFTGDKPLG